MRKFCYAKFPGAFWFRLFGRGLYFKNLRKRPIALFSERHGYHIYIAMGRFYMCWLKKC
jgi:hypothetical protein